jgi:epimerase transport system membrane fusion protein
MSNSERDDLEEMIEELNDSEFENVPTPDVAAGAGAVLDTSSERYQRIGIILIAVVFGGFGLWSLIAPLDSASFATGVVQAEGYRKPVQHLEGGLVERILIEDGEHVDEGDPLIQLDDTATKADLSAVEVRLFTALALLDRLVAERDDLETVEFSAFLVTAAASSRPAAEAVSNETALFKARRENRLGQINVLEQQFEQLENKVEGLVAMEAARQAMVLSLAEEVNDLRDLLAEGYVDKVRLRQLERNLDSTQAELVSTTAQIGTARVQIEETRLRIAQLDKQFKAEVIQQLSGASATVSDLEQRYEALQERLARTTIRATGTGTILDLSVNAIGQVIRPGETLMEIVPDSEQLFVKAQVSPTDIDSIEVGDEAEIRFSAFKRVFTVTGELIELSADRLTDPATGMPYFSAIVDIHEEDLKMLGGRTILPGMPADVLIKGEARTLFQYLMRPVDNMFARALIEE